MTPFISMNFFLCVVVVLSMAHASVQLVEEKKVSNTIYCRPRFAHPYMNMCGVWFAMQCAVVLYLMRDVV